MTEPENKEKKRSPLLGRKRPEFSGPLHPMYGRKRPELAKAMIGNKHALGAIRSPATRLKMGLAKKGIKKPALSARNRTRCGVNHPSWGKKRPDVSANLRGKKRPNMSKLLIGNTWGFGKGEKHPQFNNWSSLAPYDPEFNKKTKLFVRERDNHTCQLCGRIENGRPFGNHHIDYNKKNSDPKNLVLLCPGCHSKTNPNREYWKHYFILNYFGENQYGKNYE